MTQQEVDSRIDSRRERAEDVVNHLLRIQVTAYRLSAGAKIEYHSASRIIQGKHKYIQDKTLDSIENWLKVHRNGYRWIVENK